MIDANKLQQFLEEKDLTKQQLAGLAKLKYEKIRDILNGKIKNPGKDTVQKIAIALQVSIEEISK